jgi:hypothetical protein
MELRGAGRKERPDARSILTSTMTRVSTGNASKSSFLQLQSIPPVLRPLVRAYLLGYASAVLPRLLTLVLQHLSNRNRKTPNYALPERDENTFLESARHVLKTGLDPCRFPTFCAALVGGSTLLQVGHNFILSLTHVATPSSRTDTLSLSHTHSLTHSLIHSVNQTQTSIHTDHAIQCLSLSILISHTHVYPTQLPQIALSRLGPVACLSCHASPCAASNLPCYITFPRLYHHAVQYFQNMACCVPTAESLPIVIFSVNSIPSLEHILLFSLAKLVLKTRSPWTGSLRAPPPNLALLPSSGK